jgi:hypothetical protein
VAYRAAKVRFNRICVPELLNLIGSLQRVTHSVPDGHKQRQFSTTLCRD